MYSREKPMKTDPSRRNPPLSTTQLPSFSSTLLDEIYSSIDDNKSDRFKLPHNRFPTKQSNVEDKQTPNLRQPCLVEKKLLVHHDPIPFISSSSSSDSSSGGGMGSPGVYKQRTSCFTGAPSLMKIKTTISNQPEKSPKSEAKPKEKISALKMYNSLKQLPVSPGIRFTNFFNTLFRHGNSKKSKGSKSTQDSPSTCSSAASYYRSCLTKNRRQNEPNNGKTKRTVRFNPVSVIVDDDDYCGNDSDKFGRRITYGNGRNSNIKLVDIRSYSCEEDEDDDDDSDTSSDLFELDHLAFMGSFEGDYREELPVMKLPTFRYV